MGLHRHRERSLQWGYGPTHRLISIGGAKQCYGAVVVTVSCTSYKSSPFEKNTHTHTHPIAGARLSLADGLPSVAPTVSLFDAVVVVTARARVCRLTSLFAIFITLFLTLSFPSPHRLHYLLAPRRCCDSCMYGRLHTRDPLHPARTHPHRSHNPLAINLT